MEGTEGELWSRSRDPAKTVEFKGSGTKNMPKRLGQSKALRTQMNTHRMNLTDFASYKWKELSQN
jgi:hypothetical protein